MRSFKIPFSLDREEKIFGGYISLRQAGYLTLAVAGVSLFFFLRIWLALPLFLINLVLMLCFAFLKVQDKNADVYALYLVKYLIRDKMFVYRR